MAASFQWLVRRRPRGSGPEALPGTLELGSDGSHVWIRDELKGLVPIERFDLLATREAASNRSPLIAIHVETSDYGYVVLRGKGGTVRVLLNAAAAEDHRDGAWALERCREEHGNGWIAAAADLGSAWSQEAVRPVSKGALMSILETEWTLAEDGVEALLQAMGFRLANGSGTKESSEFEEATRLVESGTTTFGGRTINHAGQPYVLGYGKGFVGIWHRERPGPPIKRFPPSQMAQATQEWHRLVSEARAQSQQ